MSSVSGVGSKQRYTGVPLSIDKKDAPKIEKVPFECHRCGQTVDSEKGYFLEHYRVKMDRYGAPKRILCAASNGKVRAELRSVTFNGACDQCGMEQEVTATEEYPGGLRQYGGFLKQTCVVCDGKKHATCDSPGCPDADLTEIETEVEQLGIPIKTTHWVHTTSGKPECGNDGEQFFVVDTQQTDPATGTYVKVAGPFATEQLSEDERDHLENAPTATGNECYETSSEVLVGTNASAFVLSIKTNPVNEILLYDGFEIFERDDSDFTPQAPFDPSDPASIAAALGTQSQED